MAFKFIGISYTDFTPEGKETIRGYRLNFIDDNMFTDPEKGVGGESFNVWATPDSASNFGIKCPAHMALLAPFVGETVNLTFARKTGKVNGWDIDIHHQLEPTFPPEGKPKKLGANNVE